MIISTLSLHHQTGPQTVRVHLIHMPANWPWVFKIATRNGQKMTINGRSNRAVLVRVVVIAVVHQLHIHPVVDRTVLEMGMATHRIWAYQRPHRVCSIQHQVSISHSHIGRSIEEQNRFFSVWIFVCTSAWLFAFNASVDQCNRIGVLFYSFYFSKQPWLILFNKGVEL